MGEAKEAWSVGKDAWNWSTAQRRHTVLVEEPMRPREMLVEHGYDPKHLCGECRHYRHGGARQGDRCLLSLRGSPARIGYAWRPEWKSCGKWLRREVADDAATARAGDQLKLL